MNGIRIIPFKIAQVNARTQGKVQRRVTFKMIRFVKDVLHAESYHKPCEITLNVMSYASL